MLRSALLVRRHDLDLALDLCLRVLLGALLLERLARLLGHVLPRRFVGHDCSLSGSLVGFLDPPYAGIGASAHQHIRALAEPPRWSPRLPGLLGITWRTGCWDWPVFGGMGWPVCGW